MGIAALGTAAAPNIYFADSGNGVIGELIPVPTAITATYVFPPHGNHHHASRVDLHIDIAACCRKHLPSEHHHRVSQAAKWPSRLDRLRLGRQYLLYRIGCHQARRVQQTAVWAIGDVYGTRRRNDHDPRSLRPARNTARETRQSSCRPKTHPGCNQKPLSQSEPLPNSISHNPTDQRHPPIARCPLLRRSRSGNVYFTESGPKRDRRNQHADRGSAIADPRRRDDHDS